MTSNSKAAHPALAVSHFFGVNLLLHRPSPPSTSSRALVTATPSQALALLSFLPAIIQPGTRQKAQSSCYYQLSLEGNIAGHTARILPSVFLGHQRGAHRSVALCFLGQQRGGTKEEHITLRCPLFFRGPKRSTSPALLFFFCCIHLPCKNHLLLERLLSVGSHSSDFEGLGLDKAKPWSLGSTCFSRCIHTSYIVSSSSFNTYCGRATDDFA